MKRLLGLAALFACMVMPTSGFAQPGPPPEENYPVHPDAKQKPDVPAGEITKGEFHESQVFPGTTRDYWIYVPKQYDGSKPAAVMVFQDGGGYVGRGGGTAVPNVFDNLIHSGEMPVTIGVFINPGIVQAANESVQARYNRSFEYDSVDDRYAKFLIDEILPFIEKKHELKLSQDPNDRAIAGSSSGGICAFNVAWQRPDVFRRVFTTVGTYVGLRGAHEFSSLIRKVEPKPLRVFLQDGSNDLNIYAGDWWMANQAMLRSLEFSGYEVNHEWGAGGHNGKQGAAIFPDAMRWLWKDHGKVPVAVHPDKSKNDASKFLVPGADWELVTSGHQWAEGMAVTEDGTLYFTDVPGNKLYRITPDGKQELLVEDTGEANGIALGADGRLYGCSSKAKQIRAWDLSSIKMEVIAEGTHSNDIVVRHDGTIYYTDPAAGKVWMIDRKTRERKEADTFPNCNGIGLSADQSQLFVAHFSGRVIYSYMIAEDGTLKLKQPYFHMEVPANTLEGHLDGMCSTVDGWLVASSAAGVQICDQPGRVHLMLQLPYGCKRPCYIEFGGPDNKTMYVANVDKIWKRKTTLTGAKDSKPPVKPPKPQL
ncbi:MAG: SMP-30/gluconolactonase/LRE family protein [Pirellulales bacterium]